MFKTSERDNGIKGCGTKGLNNADVPLNNKHKDSPYAKLSVTYKHAPCQIYDQAGKIQQLKLLEFV